MTSEIITIPCGGVNCYLIRTDDGFILIDTGMKTGRKKLLKALQKQGCIPGTLRFILHTHADIDHAGNSAYLHEIYRVPTATHLLEVKVAESGDMAVNRKSKPDLRSPLFSIITVFLNLFPQPPFEKFTPDITLEDGFDLNAYGWNAEVIALPGHSPGSIGFLTGEHDLICGDLLMNFGRPKLHFHIDNLAQTVETLNRLRDIGIHTVYPGHGKPFDFSEVVNIPKSV